MRTRWRHVLSATVLGAMGTAAGRWSRPDLEDRFRSTPGEPWPPDGPGRLLTTDRASATQRATTRKRSASDRASGSMTPTAHSHR